MSLSSYIEMEVQCHTHQYPELLFCIGFIKDIKVYYAVSKGGQQGHLYFKLNNKIHYICKRCIIKCDDQCNLVHDSMIGGDSFKSFIIWWYKNNIINYKIDNNTIKNMIFNEPIALLTCYQDDILNKKYGYINQVMKLSINIADFRYILQQYLAEITKHITTTHIVQLYMRRYYYFDYLATQNCGISYDHCKRLFESEFGGDKHDMLREKIYKISQWEENPYDSEEVKQITNCDQLMPFY